MNVQFDWWLLIVGLVIGAALTWLVIADVRRRDDDVSSRERAVEAEWIAAEIRARGIAADTEAVEEVLRLHRLYLASMPPDDDAWEPLPPITEPTDGLDDPGYGAVSRSGRVLDGERQPRTPAGGS
jgi:hypothetical protein